MTHPSVDLGTHHGDELVVPESAPLDACIIAFMDVLSMAHPTLLSRQPVTNREVTAVLLHMHLDVCRGLLLMYDRLTFGEPLNGFEHDADGDEDDIPF
jgi:hypothetical protein